MHSNLGCFKYVVLLYIVVQYKSKINMQLSWPSCQWPSPINIPFTIIATCQQFMTPGIFMNGNTQGL